MTDLVVWVRQVETAYYVEINRRADDEALYICRYSDHAGAVNYARRLAAIIRCDCVDSDTGATYD